MFTDFGLHKRNGLHVTEVTEDGLPATGGIKHVFTLIGGEF